MIITRRNALRGLFAAPAIIAIDRLMPVKAYAAIIKPNPNVLWYNGKVTFDEAFYYCPYRPVDWYPVQGVDTMKNYIIYKEPL